MKKISADRLRTLGGDPANTTHLLGQYELQFGQYRGMSFKWLVENSLGYAADIANSTAKETMSSSNLSKNMHAFLRYMRSFHKGRAAMAQKANEQKELGRADPQAVTMLPGSSATATTTVTTATVTTALTVKLSPLTVPLPQPAPTYSRRVAARSCNASSTPGPQPNLQTSPGEYL